MPQQIIDDFQPDDLDFNDDFLPDEQSQLKTVNENEPDTFNEGFINSILGGEAFDAGLEGAKGFAKGAILDLPSNIWSMIKSAPGLMTYSMGPLGELLSRRSTLDRTKEFLGSLPETVDSFINTMSESGNKPEEFGRMMGNITGQPLVTHGITHGVPSGTFGMKHGIPSGISMAGVPVQATGNIIKKYGIGMPRLVESRLQRGLERGIGSAIESVGNRMRNINRNDSIFKRGELITEEMPTIRDGEYVDVTPRVKKLPPSKVFHYGEQGLKDGDPIIPEQFKVIRNENPKSSLRERIKEIESLPDELIEGQELPVGVRKPKIRPNRDGTFTNMDTGEILDSSGNSIIEINKKAVDLPIKDVELDKNSPFFVKNRQ